MDKLANPRFARSAATGDPVTHERRDRLAQDYEISIRGNLGETVMQAFPGLQAERRGKDTLLVGALTDQPALHGVLTQIEALGLELLEVRRMWYDRGRLASPHGDPSPSHLSFVGGLKCGLIQARSDTSGLVLGSLHQGLPTQALQSVPG
jgi:hypothetical protein